MVDLENIKEVVNQAAVQAANVVMMMLRDTEAGSQLITVASHRWPKRQRHSRPILNKPAFNWDVQDR